MRHGRLSIIGLMVASATIVAEPATALDLGDAAPPLTIAEWVKGSPVDMTKEKGNRVYLVEFWAVWCPPCKVSIPRLTSLQKKFDSELTIVGVTVPDNRGNSPSAIRKFTKDLGDDLDYTVAIDKAEATANAYMRSSNIMGIPFAFLVDKEGKIAWMGTPLDPGLENVVKQVIAGKYDVRRARIQAEVDERLGSIWQAAQMGQPNLARDGLVELLKLDPANELGLDFMTNLHIEALEDLSALREWTAGHIAEHGDNPEVMTATAQALCNISNLTMRLPDLALEAASKAYTASNKSDPAAISVLARAHFEIGELDRAIKFQEEAIASANGKNDQAFRDLLSYYVKCKQLHTGTN